MSQFVMRIFAMFCLFGAAVCARAANELPPASNLLARVIARAEHVAREKQTNHYIYEKRTVTAELNDKDAVTKSTEKLYKVMLVGGLPFPRLTKVQGRELSAKELEKENQREVAFRQRVTRVDLNKKAKRQAGVVTADLVSRFDFQVKKREIVEGRDTLVVTFAARKGAPDKTMEDKIYQHVAGTVWIDEVEAEIAKLDASVNGPIPLGWFGAIGSLQKFQATMERLRLPDGVWVNRKSMFWVAARRLFTTIRSKTTEESSGFHRE